MGELSADKLNNIKKTNFNYFRGSFHEMPKLALAMPLHSACLILAASSPAAKCQKIIIDETTQPPILKDGGYFDKVEMEPMALNCTHDIHEVIVPKHMPGILDEEKSFIEKQELVVSTSDPNTKPDDGISFVWNQYKEGHVQKCWRQIQAEAQSAKTGYEQCKAHFTDVYNITPDDLAADISILEISETTSREASENDDAAVGYVNDEYWKILACVTKCKVLNPLCQVAHL